MECFLDLPTDPLWPKREAVLTGDSTFSGRRLDVCALEHIDWEERKCGCGISEVPIRKENGPGLYSVLFNAYIYAHKSQSKKTHGLKHYLAYNSEIKIKMAHIIFCF